MKADFQIERGTLDEIVRRLAEDTGIDTASLEPRRIAWTIQRRCRELGLSDPLAYAAQLDSSSPELVHLMEGVVNQETRFFRDPPVFDNLCAWAREMAAKGTSPLRILSAPCSTGQEAYSLAAVLHYAGIALSNFSVDAFDISPAALEVAKRGVYPAGALENAPEMLRLACATRHDQHWHVREELRRCIRFERRNLAQPGALAGGAGYHLIFCRNLFIYLNGEARKVLARELSEALLPGGMLVVGPGDRVSELNAFFAPLKPAGAFGMTHKPASRVSAASAAGPFEPTATAARVRRRVSPAVAEGTNVPPPGAAEFYRRAVDCLERGNSRQAERRCRQALYLAPDYLPALEMLETLWHLHPNPRIKRALTARIHRIRGADEAGFVPQGQPEGATP